MIRKLVCSFMITLCLVLLIASSSVADDSQDAAFYNAKLQLERLKNIPVIPVAKVGKDEITNHDVWRYQIFISLNGELLSEDEVLDRLIKEELYLQLAHERGAAASLAEGREMAERPRQLLTVQDAKAYEIHHRFLKLMDMTDDEYWNEYAPAEYQRMISMQNLTNLLISEGRIDPDPHALIRFQQALYQERAHSHVEFYGN